MASYLKFTTEYVDDTTRDITIGEIDSSKVNAATLKTKVKNFNDSNISCSIINIFSSEFQITCHNPLPSKFNYGG